MASAARLRPEEHSRHPWRIDEIASDFDLIDAWALPASGSLEDFDDLCRIFLSLDLASGGGSKVSSALFAVRTKLGERFGWDESLNTLPIPGCEESSLRERLPPDLPPEIEESAGGSPFRPVYRTQNEWALELSNSTVHAVMHLGWVAERDDRYRGQMGVYVKPRGRMGKTYMAAIAPFRHRIVYPAMLRRIETGWAKRSAS